MNEHRHQFGRWRAEPAERGSGAVAQPVAASTRLRSPGGARAVACLANSIGTLLLWIDRYRQRRLLDGLSDFMLKDIGITRADVDRETGKRFWRE